MSTTVNINFSPQQILTARGLGTDNRAQKFFTNEVFKQCQPYVPRDEGILSTTVNLADNSITYVSPYARYQYYGKVMAGKAPKHATGKSLKYNGAPMRGSHWDKRCWVDRGNEILQGVASITGGTVK
ncbi:minor capsid protein [Clostridium saccharobutylicum]|uniref:minor capsid protein n=1 Tax=Clostridium saccharobutylicum TaxID=169679 RepID=UPI0015913248|nr:minor capsid protein [Clostridium saccharobutylicum]